MKKPIILANALLLSCSAMLSTSLTAAEKMFTDNNDGRNWPSYGRTYSEDHYTPLEQVNKANVGDLGLAWSLNLDVGNTNTSPLAVDGILYLAAGYSIVHAIDGVTGELLWKYDPKAIAAAGKTLRAGWGIRGLAYWEGKLFVGTQDGRLLALDAKKGELIWSQQTTDIEGVFISGPPRVFNNKVIIGNGGADFVAMRGYVTAYNTDTGKKEWRFYIVPGKPGVKDGEVSDSAMEWASDTWTGEWWKYGGGGAAWNAMTYDPEFNRIYIGTGNSGPYNEEIRNPGGGDNLFLASVLALDADSGEYAWHYQNTPNDIWDYNSAQDMTLATIDIDGKPRKVMFHAPKNGFFYVIDRENGKLISAEKLGTVNWAESIDLATGRPVEAPFARYGTEPVLIWPSFQGTHFWPPQSYSPKTGLVYVPIIDMPVPFARLDDPKEFDPILFTPDFVGLKSGDGDVPADAGVSYLKAWDPLTQKAKWQVKTPGISNSGTMASAGGLVFQGLADGYLHAYDADNGKDLWAFDAKVAVTGPPISYSVDGVQYITVATGPLNGAPGAFGSISAQFGWDSRLHPRRLLTFKLGGNGAVPATPAPVAHKALFGEDMNLDMNLAAAGVKQWARCQLCHGPGVVAGGNAPDLRASAIPLTFAGFEQVVRQGALEHKGMPKFAELSDTQLEQIRHYIRAKARGLSF